MSPRLLLLLAILAGGCSAHDPASWVEPNTGMEFVRIPAGSFRMGAPPGEPGREAGETLHRVTLSRPFELGRYEVTQEQWQAVMGSNPSHFHDCPRCPVERVSYRDVEEFIARLERLSGEPFRLPSEAEWEYACRAGTTTPFSTGDNLTAAQANYDARYPYAGHPPGEYRAATTPAGSLPPNPWGLYDMHGNVWEWTGDDDCPYPTAAQTDPRPRCGSGLKVIRGGSWYFNADSARCGLRYTHAPSLLGFSLGFRLVHGTDPGSPAGGR